MAFKLVIVESPNKIAKITKLLGQGFKVMASLGHIRDLPKDDIGIDIENNYKATYQVTKSKVVKELRDACSKASTVYIATDPDREGDGIAWHLAEVLKLSYPKARRMTFNEITKTAVQNALEEANKNGKMDMNSVNAYQARRFVDRITGFKASPLLWKNITGAKSAGRVQSVTTKLIIDREEKIKKHVPEEKFMISGLFEKDIHADLKQVPNKHDEALKVLNLCKDAKFTIGEKGKKTVWHSAPPAFKTSVYQQEVGKRFGMSPKDAMRIAQTLYEKGKITYHRTDTTRLSNQFKMDTKEYVTKKYGTKYLNDELKGSLSEEVKETKKNDKNVQAAHEAIRPTDINAFSLNTDDFKQIEKSVYKMIWIRAVASLMAKEECERYTITILLSNTDKYWFTSGYTHTIFPGFKILSTLFSDPDDVAEKNNKVIMTVKKGDNLKYVNIESNQTYTEAVKRYTESSLVKELENKGIGRPSTYANIISTVQTRKYTVNKNSEKVMKDSLKDTLKNGVIKNTVKKIQVGDTKKRLFPTELGIKVTDFLVKSLDYLMDYSFTSNLEDELDQISNGEKNWLETVDNLTTTLQSKINAVPIKEKLSTDERKKKVSDRTVGIYEGSTIEYYTGIHGPFVKYKSKCYSLPKDCSEKPSLEVAIDAINNKGKKTDNSIVSHECKIGNKQGKIQGVKGPYGNYLRFVPNEGKSVNYFLPKSLKEDDEAVKNLTLEDCLKQVEFASNYKKKK